MPHKTRRQKQLADIRRERKEKSSQSVKEYKPADSLSVNPEYPYKYQHTAVMQPVTSEGHRRTSVISEKISDYSQVNRDLLKIVFFTFVALMFQGVLYFVLQRG